MGHITISPVIGWVFSPSNRRFFNINIEIGAFECTCTDRCLVGTVENVSNVRFLISLYPCL